MGSETEYVVAVSGNPAVPVGSRQLLPCRARQWVGTTVRPDGVMGDLTAFRWDQVCPECEAEGSVRLRGHDCPNQPVPPPWTPHPDQLDMLEGLLP